MSEQPETSERPEGQRWSIVLAGGSGIRLSGLTTVGATTVPKQYCGLNGGPSLLRLALRRAIAVATAQRTLVVVAEEHRPWWRRELAGLPASNVIPQPRNRGTAVGLLLPLLEVLRRDAAALVAMFPADHHVRREAALADGVRRSLELAAMLGDTVLVGVRPTKPDGDLGWIVPSGTASLLGGTRVGAFREKPPAAEAMRLWKSGGLVNTFILAARARRLRELCERHLPAVVAALSARGSGPLHELYDELPAHDLSREVLARAPESLRVVEAPACGWSDLGTPQRVASCLRAMPSERHAGDFIPAFLDLARQLPSVSAKEVAP